MAKLPAYVGPAAFGLKMGVIVPGSNLLQMITDVIQGCDRDNLLDDTDVLCVTESIVARSQNNYVTIDEVTQEVQDRFKAGPKAKIGVLFPIASRNRFSMILEAIAAAVPWGEVVVQLSWPRDEVGNQVISEELASRLGKVYTDSITDQELAGTHFKHPVTEVDYIQLYRQTIEEQGAKATIVLSNDPKHILTFSPDGVVVADIHTREKTRLALGGMVNNVLLSELCSSPLLPVWSEWGLLGSNMSSGKRLKLAPRDASAFARDVQREVAELTGKEVEVIIYGDGAYKDPTTQIYELADPQPVFGATDGFANVMREGFKYKYLADLYHQEGKTAEEIEELLKQHPGLISSQTQVEAEGTTPRRMEDVIASLADLVSGSADAGTPLILVKGFFG
jgi:hypothetical protein